MLTDGTARPGTAWQGTAGTAGKGESMTGIDAKDVKDRPP